MPQRFGKPPGYKPSIAGKDHKRPPAKSVYPLVYTRQLQDFDNWDHMFHVHFFNRASVYDFDEPPKSVLELGCGSGIWVVDAAKRWKKTTFVGFDLEKLQPDLFRCGLTDLATRILWVHGNFLDTLPFPSEHFDFIRIHCVGLGVPEDKWQDLFADVHRVMKPGGQLEITEENQIFPSGPSPRDHESSSSGSLLISEEEANNPNPKLLINTSAISLEIVSPISPISENLLFDTLGSTDSERNSSRGSASQSLDYQVNPRDHRRLSASWTSMLRSRFIASAPPSVLPLYLSAAFDRVQTLPRLEIRLPHNSGVEEPELTEDSSSSKSSMSSVTDSAISFRMQPKSPRPLVPSTWFGDRSYSTIPLPNSSIALHLARRFHTVSACKEAMWAEYKILFSNSPTVSKLGGRNGPVNGCRNTARDEFEFHWSNWVDDMTDRIGMQSVVSSALSWSIPPTSDLPTSVAWRDRCGVINASEDLECPDADICRSLRCFLAWKT